MAPRSRPHQAPDRLRRTIRWIGWLLLDYRAPTSGPPVETATKTSGFDARRWIASAGGLGAIQTYPHALLLGFLLIALLNLDDAYARDDMSWAGMIVASLTYCAVPGFLTGRRLKSFWPGGFAGGLIGPIGIVVALVIHGLVSGDGKILLYSLLVLWVLPEAALLGFVFGAAGAAVAQPRHALHAIRSPSSQITEHPPPTL